MNKNLVGALALVSAAAAATAAEPAKENTIDGRRCFCYHVDFDPGCYMIGEFLMNTGRSDGHYTESARRGTSEMVYIRLPGRKPGKALPAELSDVFPFEVIDPYDELVLYDSNGDEYIDVGLDGRVDKFGGGKPFRYVDCSSDSVPASEKARIQDAFDTVKIRTLQHPNMVRWGNEIYQVPGQKSVDELVDEATRDLKLKRD